MDEQTGFGGSIPGMDEWLAAIGKSMPGAAAQPFDMSGMMDAVVKTQAQAMEALMKQAAAPGGMPNTGGFGGGAGFGTGAMPDMADVSHWAGVAGKLQQMWLAFQQDQLAKAPETFSKLGDPTQWIAHAASQTASIPFMDAAAQQKLWGDTVSLWQSVLGGFGGSADGAAQLPRKDKRFADAAWQQSPAHALIHQSYLLIAEQIHALADSIEGLDPVRREQIRFAARNVTDALSPAHFPALNPQVMARAMETKGESLIKGMEHLLADLKKGQLTHTDPDAFRLGENIAVTPGKVVHETPLFQLIQYSPATERVLETPLVVFPPWINRFYILDLNPAKSFVRWAVDQGISLFMVSWKSADASMKDVIWDDYIKAQIEAIDVVRQRLKVPSVHTIGYCVAGTTLAATLALLARRGEAEKVKSATFFTAQVDFEAAGELKLLTRDETLRMMDSLAPDGYLDGRYMAASFNMLRSNDLIWSYVIKNYLMGEDYPAFDLLHWNGDTTNLPYNWQRAYLTDLYRDNRLVVPDSMVVDGTPIDLRQINTPCYIQAGIDDHIAPAQSVWRLTRHLSGPWQFVLAGSGHIAGVVNPPSSGKYQYWLNDDPAVSSLEAFRAGASETPGSWWPHWVEWLRGQGGEMMKAKGKRVPGSKDDDGVIEDAPGRYVGMR